MVMVLDGTLHERKKLQVNSNSIYFRWLVQSQEYTKIIVLFCTFENGLAV